MTWLDDSIPIVRALIGDLGTSPTYTDDRLGELLIVAARYVDQELDWSITYTINVVAQTISPAPDVTFINFMALKAACIADVSTFRTHALAAGIKAKCGPAVIETMGHIQGFKDLIEVGPCKAYETLKDEYRFGNPVINAVLSPFVSNTFDPRTLWNGGSYYDRER